MYLCIYFCYCRSFSITCSVLYKARESIPMSIFFYNFELNLLLSPLYIETIRLDFRLTSVLLRTFLIIII